MFYFLCKTLLHSRNVYTCHYNPSSSSSSLMVVSLSLLRYLSSDSAHTPHSFTLSYLTQTCGLSPKSALSASKIVRFESSVQPDSVLSCFQNYGFSETQISEMIRKFPKVLCCNPDNTISPKVDFFRSKGASTSEIARIFTFNPYILKVSLENQLVHAFNILINMFQSEHKAAIEVIKHNPYVLHVSPEAALIPNVKALRENGVPDSNILWLFLKYWRCVCANPIKFEKAVQEVKEIGFDPLTLQFVVASMVFVLVPKSRRDRRFELFKRWGWSDKDITTAFKKHPLCMSISDDKLMAVMDFYVKQLGVLSSVIVNCPVLLRYSLKKRLIPRGAVIEYLSSKGLIKLDSKISSMFKCPERDFLEKYVKCHEDAPHLIELYNQKLKLSDTMESGEDEE